MVPHYIRGMHQFITWMILLCYEVIGFSGTPIKTFDFIFFPYGCNLILERFTASFVIKLCRPVLIDLYAVQFLYSMDLNFLLGHITPDTRVHTMQH